MGYLSTNEENIPGAKLTRSHKSNFMFCKVTSSVFRCSFLCTLCKLTFCHKEFFFQLGDAVLQTLLSKCLLFIATWVFNFFTA